MSLFTSPLVWASEERDEKSTCPWSHAAVISAVLKKRCLEDKCFLKCSEPSLSQVNYVVPFLGWLTECCLDTMPALFG